MKSVSTTALGVTVLGSEKSVLRLDQVQVVSIWTGIHRRTVLPDFEEPCGIRGRVSSTGGKVLIWSQWSLLPTAVCPENVHSSFDAVKLDKVLTGIHERGGFPGLEELFSACCRWLSCNAFILGHFWCHHCIPWPWRCGFWCHICHTFDILDHLIMRYCVDVGHLGKWCRVRIARTSDDVITQLHDPRTPMIDFRHVDKCWYSAIGTLLFWGPLLQHYR